MVEQRRRGPVGSPDWTAVRLLPVSWATPQLRAPWMRGQRVLMYCRRQGVAYTQQLRGSVWWSSKSIVAEPADITSPGVSRIDRGSSAARRVQAIDIARGVAMLLVCVSHFVSTQVVARGNRLTAELLTVAAGIASPTFVFMSGAILGIAYAGRESDFRRFRLKLVDRALFLLTIGHLLLMGSRWHSLPDHRELFSLTFITDASAVSILVVAYLVPVIDARARLRIAA